jgi:hypothetical protein
VRGWRSCTYSHTASSEGSGIRHCWKTWCQIAVEPLYKELRVSGEKKESKAQLKYVRRQPPDEILLRLFFSGVEKPYQRQSRYRICDYHHMILNNFPPHAQGPPRSARAGVYLVGGMLSSAQRSRINYTRADRKTYKELPGIFQIRRHGPASHL